MAAKSIYTKSKLVCRAGRIGENVFKPLFAPIFSRSMTTEPELVASSSNPPSIKILPAEPLGPQPLHYRKPPTVLATIHRFPSLEPIRFDSFSSVFLQLPLRNDILHRAVVYEGDAHRLGRGKAKWRNEVHGSGRKIRPQKGSGRARLGDKKSPMLRGGGVAHGPKPRDFSTGLQKKVYDLAWRIALSYRYRRGDLVVVEDSLEIEEPDAGLMLSILRKHQWRADNKPFFVTAYERPNLASALKELETEGRVLTMEEVDVKDLLEMGKVVIEREALLWFEQEHNANAS